MGRMEEYYLWKRGELNKKMDSTTLEMFKTNPTDDQLIAWEAYDKRLILLFILGIALYGFFGYIVGLIVGVS